MGHRNYKASFAAIVLLGSLALAPAAQAQSRDSGIGPVIAAQGNQALGLIRAELKAAVQALQSAALPRPYLRARANRVSAPAGTSGGATIVAAATVRCAE